MSTPRELDELAGQPVDDVDVRLLAKVAALYDTVDPVPPGLIERINFGVTLDALHTEIAELQRSSDLAGVRSGDATAARTVTFTSSTLSVMITIAVTSADRARIDGWLAPGGAATIELRTVAGTSTVGADADGRFVFDDVARGLAQFVVRPPAGVVQPPVMTPSIEI